MEGGPISKAGPAPPHEITPETIRHGQQQPGRMGQAKAPPTTRTTPGTNEEK